ncbi:MAG TPA: GNAT family N-acetyltransferase [Candidatus Angelobacter sp.]|nr:GNAT family N-acetyltransferase [Candidatus Angelobacter sp.]
MTPILETRRLILRPLELADAGQAQVLFPQWEIVRYLTNVIPWPYPPDGAYTFYRDVALPAVERGEEWYWMLRPKSNPNQLIGAITLMKNKSDNRGFWIDLPWRQQGLMSEACEAATDYWFNVLGFPVLRVSKAIANTASRRISEKQGMRVIAREDRDYVSGRFPAEIWEITAEEWRLRKRVRDCRQALR